MEPTTVPEPLDRACAARLAAARAAWPGVTLPDDVFLGRVRELIGDADPPEAVARLRVEDLYVACACAAGDAVAIARFEASFFAEIDAAYRRFDKLPLTLDDVRQRMREKLFVQSPPALAAYAGRGDLRSWLRAAALHLLVNVATRETRERPTADVFFDVFADGGPDAEAAFVKHACRAEFEAALAAALDRLTNRERTLLRYAFADGLGVDRIGAVFRVHRATAARWITKARERLVAETRAELMARLHVTEHEALSIARAAMSQVGSTLLGRLGPSAAGDGARRG